MPTSTLSEISRDVAGCCPQSVDFARQIFLDFYQVLARVSRRNAGLSFLANFEGTAGGDRESHDSKAFAGLQEGYGSKFRFHWAGSQYIL